MLLKRLFAIIITVIIAVTFISTNGVKVYATDDGDIVFYFDDDNAETITSESEDILILDESITTEDSIVIEEPAASEETIVSEETTATEEITVTEAPVVTEEQFLIEDNPVADNFYRQENPKEDNTYSINDEAAEGIKETDEAGQELNSGSTVEEEQIAEEIEELDENIYSIMFYPGPGVLISEFELGEDITDWEYDTGSFVLTLYAYGYKKLITGVKYALTVPDGSKSFLGWYYDEAMTERVNLEEGIAFEGDITLYAAYLDSEPIYEEELIVADSGNQWGIDASLIASAKLEDDTEIFIDDEESIFYGKDELISNYDEETAAFEDELTDEMRPEFDDLTIEEDIPDAIHSVSFYQGEGNLISEFNVGEEVSDWDYDTSNGVMTLYVSESVEVLKGVSYAIDVADGSKEFKGWYYDEAGTLEANLEEGISVGEDVALFAAFDESKSLPKEDIAKAETESYTVSKESIVVDMAYADDVVSDEFASNDESATNEQTAAEKDLAAIDYEDNGREKTIDVSVEEKDGLVSSETEKEERQEDEQGDGVRTVSFYPGEGTLISEFKVSDKVDDWDYNVVDGVMTLFVSESVSVLKGIEYSLDVADDSKSFDGWYYDEARTQKADLETGINVDKNASLYAAFGDSKTVADELTSDARQATDKTANSGELAEPGVEELTIGSETAFDEAVSNNESATNEQTTAEKDMAAIEDNDIGEEINVDASSEANDITESGEDEQGDGSKEELEDLTDMIHAISFYPGEGKLISEFNVENNEYEWEYDRQEHIMTLHVPGTVAVLKDIDYALEVADGSKAFNGWYYDEALTQKADLTEGIPVDKDIALYAGFITLTDFAYNETGASTATPPNGMPGLDNVLDNSDSGEGGHESGYEIVDNSEFLDEDFVPSEEDQVQEEVIDPVYAEKEIVPQYDIDERDEALFTDADIATSNLKISSLEKKNYTGDAVTFSQDEIRVYYNGIRLQEGEDYKLTYANNINAFTAPGDFNNLSDGEKAELKAPAVKVSLIGNYTGSATMYFDIKGLDISKAYLATSGVMTARYLDKAFDQHPVVKAELPDGKEVNLTEGKEYDIFYNRITNVDGVETIDYSEKLSAAQVAKCVKDATATNPGEDIFFLVNMRGKGNFTGILASENETNWAPRLQVMSKASVEASFLQLDNAILSKKIPAQEYKENSEGLPLSRAEDVIRLFKEGEIEVSIAGHKLTYVEDDVAATTITEEGYYFRVVNPAADGDINCRVGTNNYVTLVATDIPEYNRLAGNFNASFEIEGAKLTIKSINTSLGYDGKTVLVYSDHDEDGDGYIDVDVKASVQRLNAVVTDSNGQVITSDRYTISTDYDTAETGRVIVTFEGKTDRGTTGSVSKKIKIEKRKLTEGDVKVNFADQNMSPEGVPLNGGLSEPEIIVRLKESDAILTENKDYTVTYSDNTDVGQIGSVTVKFVGNYSGKLDKVLYFRIAKMYLSNENIEVMAEDKVYKENAGANYFKSKPILNNDGNDLRLKADYVYAAAPTYYYAENITERNASGKIIYSKKKGTPIEDDEVVHAGALIEVRFSIIPSRKTKNYTAEKDARGNFIPIEFSTTYRMGKMSIESAKVTIEDQEYDNGYSVIPDKDDITVTLGSGQNAVTLGRNDYLIIDAVSCEEVGTATLVIQGRGRYVGTKEVNYKIVKGLGEIN